MNVSHTGHGAYSWIGIYDRATEHFRDVSAMPHPSLASGGGVVEHRRVLPVTGVGVPQFRFGLLQLMLDICGRKSEIVDGSLFIYRIFFRCSVYVVLKWLKDSTGLFIHF